MVNVLLPPSCAARSADAHALRQGCQVLGDMDAGLVQFQQFDLLGLLAGAENDDSLEGPDFQEPDGSQAGGSRVKFRKAPAYVELA